MLSGFLTRILKVRPLFLLFGCSPDDVQSIISGKLALRYSGSQVQLLFTFLSRDGHVGQTLDFVPCVDMYGNEFKGAKE